MSIKGRFCHVFTLLSACSLVAAAHPFNAQENPPSPWLQAAPSAEQPESWLSSLWKLPLFQWLNPVDPEFPEIVVPLASIPAAPVCTVEPLAELEDPEAITFEFAVDESARVNLSGLTPATAMALTRFERVVGRAGGRLDVQSAYRPLAYQLHLQEVWDKYRELVNHLEPECQALKAQVETEYLGHDLLLTQRPVPVSDHTLGIGFDARVMPAVKTRRFRASIDRLARRAGVMRPDVRRDPVHFRLIGGRG